MTAIPVLAVFGAVIFPGLLYYVETHHKKRCGLLMKAVSSLTFVILGALCSAHSEVPSFAGRMVFGEIFGAFGDVVINLGPFFEGSMLPFCFGGAFFMAGHVLFISAFSSVTPKALLLSVLLSVLVFTAVLWLLFRLTETDRRMRILTSLYMLTVSAFFAFSLAAFIMQPSFGRGLLAFGALVFLFGDFDLMLQTMGKKKWKFVFPCMYVYYPAQVLIALSLYYFR